MRRKIIPTPRELQEKRKNARVEGSTIELAHFRYVASMEQLADVIMEEFGDPGLRTGPHPRSPAEAERKGYLRGVKQASSLVRDAHIVDFEVTDE